LYLPNFEERFDVTKKSYGFRQQDKGWNKQTWSSIIA